MHQALGSSETKILPAYARITFKTAIISSWQGRLVMIGVMRTGSNA